MGRILTRPRTPQAADIFNRKVPRFPFGVESQTPFARDLGALMVPWQTGFIDATRVHGSYPYLGQASYKQLDQYCGDFTGPGTDSAVPVPSIATWRPDGNQQGSYTVVALCKVDSVAGRSGIWQDGLGTGGNGHYFYYEEPATIRHAVKIWDLDYAYGTVILGKWHTIIATFDAVSNATEVYVDGIKGTGATSATVSDTFGPYIGAVFYPNFSRELDGNIAFVAFHSTAWSEGKVKRFMRDPLQYFKPANDRSLFIPVGVPEPVIDKSPLFFGTNF